MFTEGLSEDQRDIISARLIEYDNNRMSKMCQTDRVRIINNDEELK